MDDGKPRLLDQVRQHIRVRNYSIRTETVYAEWVKRYIRFHRYRHPAEMGRRKSRLFSPLWRWRAMFRPLRRLRPW